MADTLNTFRSHFDADTMMHKARALRAIQEHGHKAFDTPEGLLMVAKCPAYLPECLDRYGLVTMNGLDRGDSSMDVMDVFPVDHFGNVRRVDVRLALGYDG